MCSQVPGIALPLSMQFISDTSACCRSSHEPAGQQSDGRTQAGAEGDGLLEIRGMSAGLRDSVRLPDIREPMMRRKEDHMQRLWLWAEGVRTGGAADLGPP